MYQNCTFAFYESCTWNDRTITCHKNRKKLLAQSGHICQLHLWTEPSIFYIYRTVIKLDTIKPATGNRKKIRITYFILNPLKCSQ